MQTKFELALSAVTDYILSDLPPITGDIEFTDKFLRRMKKLFRRREKPYYILINTAAKRAACIIICIIIAISALTISVRAFLPEVWNIIIEWFDEYISLGFDVDTDTAPTTIEEIMSPKYVPEGMEAVGRLRDSKTYETVLLQDGNAVCTVSQRSYEVPLLFDDDSYMMNVLIHRHDGIIVTSSDARYCSWNDGKYYYIIADVYRSLSDDELIAIAESMYE